MSIFILIHLSKCFSLICFFLAKVLGSIGLLDFEFIATFSKVDV